MGHIFISYSRQDSDFAEVVAGRLRKARLDPWKDVDQIDPGVDWVAEVDRAIRTSIAVVVAMSPDAKAADYVTYEWAFALGAGIPVIPLVYKKVDLHSRLQTLNCLDFSSNAARPWDRLITRLTNLQTALSDDDLPEIAANVQKYLDKAKKDSVSFETLRERVDKRYSDELLGKAMDLLPKQFRPAALRGGRKGIGRVQRLYSPRKPAPATPR